MTDQVLRESAGGIGLVSEITSSDPQAERPPAPTGT